MLDVSDIWSDKTERSYLKDYQEKIRLRKQMRALEEANLRDSMTEETPQWKRDFLKNEAAAIAAAKKAFGILYGN